jgi:multiple RNA-binding domain-containing protein 1
MAKQSKTVKRSGPKKEDKEDKEDKKAWNVVVPSEPTTRICMKNVPYSVTEIDQVKRFLFQSQESYFSTTPLTITDCRILPKRHMVFVGFQNKECAMACVKCLHNTYWKTSKIVVEFAFPPKETKKNDKQLGDSSSKPKEAEPKASSQKETSSSKLDRKKRDLLDYIGGNAAKPTFWGNDDILPSTVEDNHHSRTTDEVDTTDNDSTDNEDGASDSESSSVEDDAEPLFESTKGMSDMEFLRAKTVRVEELPEEISDNMDADPENSITGEEDEVVEMKLGSSTDDVKQPTAGLEEEPEVSSSRLFIRNLPFSVEEDDLMEYFSQFGALDECHVPVDDQHRSKGFAFVSFKDPDRSQYAREESDGKDFQGRIIQVLPARSAKNSQNSASMPSTYKGKQEVERQNQADKDQKGWSASFVRGDAVVDNLAFRLGLKKGDVLGVKDGLSAGDAAVRLALGETAIIEENRKYFAAHGIDMEALVSLRKDQIGSEIIERSKVSILVKNLPGDTTSDELLKSFGAAGINPKRILLPPSRTIAVVEYAHSNEAKSAFRKLAYRRFKDVPLYLEWAPLAATKTDDGNTPENVSEVNEVDAVDETTERDVDSAKTALPTLYVKNLNFSTTEEELYTFFSSLCAGVRSVRIPTKVTPAKRVAGKVLRDEKSVSMGFGFVEFTSSEAAMKAIERVQDKMLAGHKLEVQPTKLSGQQPAGVNTKKKSSKLMVRNVPFQANRKELLTLFGSFGQLKKLRLPKKFDGNHRGFAFVDFVSSKEAAEAMKTLSKTHLYGRHLVIEWAEDDEEEETKTTQSIESTSQPMNKKIRFS